MMIPEPPKRHRYGFKKMAIGEYKAFVFETAREAFKCQCAAANTAYKTGWKFITKSEKLEDQVILVNVWRVNHSEDPG